MSANALQQQDVVIDDLLAEELISTDDLTRARRLAENDGDHRGVLYQLLKQRSTTPAVVLPLLASRMNAEVAPIEEIEMEDSALSLMSRDLVLNYWALPLRIEGDSLWVAFADPNNFEAVETLEFTSERSVRRFVLDNYTLVQLVEAHYGTMPDEDENQTSIETLLNEFEEGSIVATTDVSTLAREEEIEAAPVVQLLNRVLTDAVRKGASDIHFEFYEKNSHVRFRIDGALLVAYELKKGMDRKVVTRLKILSGLDISKTRVPQDGRIRFAVGNRKIDFRVSTVPTSFGEKVVLRVLDRAKVALDFKELGIDGADRDLILTTLAYPYGMILLTGPTGSGKTTTLYTMISALNTPESNIMTAEDPVEYDLPGINQVGINPEAGITFAGALRAFLRQDPDVVLVGEMRDEETSNIAIRAAQTGHLVLSTLHTNDSAGAITRLTEMKIDPFQIGSTVKLVIAQRLVRRICSQCRAEVTYEKERLRLAGLTEEDASRIRFLKGKGCQACNGTGYKGRIGVYELLPITGEIEDMIYRGNTVREVKAKAVQNGMQSLRTSGVERVKAGLTTLDEVIEHTPAF